ncbi:hypothetical protein [Halogeometricum limi]|uniref:Gluconate 2-dehydrogenase subunit 3 n=1 Tax=Halogeometricum limi TaxID=555875 RepID=A0A1I6I5J0_9EURY|nr:hypothetical protein [Halogeometricum limi]SFR61904.1 hypothetical protein SAMN04488124_2849 [Halogeometricum limi]
MKLTRRDALVALGGLTAGVAVSGTTASVADVADDTETAAVGTEARVDAATAIAAVVYPSAVTAEREFVETFVFGRSEPRPGHFDGLASAIDDVEQFARARFGGPTASLSSRERRRLLDDIGAYAAHANPNGTSAERVRHYLVNDLLYALVTHPKGGELFGVPNPPGYPGGTERYQRGPTR